MENFSEAKPKVRVKPFNFEGKGYRARGIPLVRTREILRNDQCPCGKVHEKVYRDGKGEVFKREIVKIKFKNCCLNTSDDAS